MQEFLATARLAAEAGGQVLRERAGRMGAVRTKSSSVDFVTDADIESGVAVAKAIMERHEGARFVVEEAEVYGLAGAEQGRLDDGEVWVVDPLDGTTSYMHGYPCYSVSVALLRDAVPVAGAVHNVPAVETFSAARGLGAWLDGSRIQPSLAETIETSLVITGFPYDRTSTLDRQLEIFSRALKRVHGIRRDGSAAMDCCQVACGRADAFWELALSPWDISAGALILREAGALITGFDGCEWTPEVRDIVAANPQLHPAMLEMVNG